MGLAQRLSRLGTETAFAVAQTAAAWRAAGNTVYPFHLGDLNVPMAPHIVEAMNAAIADGKTGYCPGAGIPPLREALADDIGSRRGTTYDPAHRRDDRGQARHHKVCTVRHGPREEGALPEPGIPDLRVADRIPRRRRGTVRLRADR